MWTCGQTCQGYSRELGGCSHSRGTAGKVTGRGRKEQACVGQVEGWAAALEIQTALWVFKADALGPAWAGRCLRIHFLILNGLIYLFLFYFTGGEIEALRC